MRDEGQRLQFYCVRGCCGGGQIQERVVWRKVVSVINSGHMMEVGVLNERVAVSRQVVRSSIFESGKGILLGVHQCIKEQKCKQTCNCKIHPRFVKKVLGYRDQRVAFSCFGCWSGVFDMLVVQPPDDRWCIDEWIDLEMNAKTQQNSCQSNLPLRDSP